MKRAAIYSRVSTVGQVADNQRFALLQVAAARGWEVIDASTNQGASGVKRRAQRPALDRLCKDETQGRFETVMACSTDRIGWSVHVVSGFIAEFERDMMREDTVACLSRARAQGKRLGWASIDSRKNRAICDTLAAGADGILKIAAKFGVRSGTVQRIKADTAA